MGNASGRDILSGVFRHTKEQKYWRITLLQLPNGFSSAMIAQIQRSGADGIITSDLSNPTVRKLAQTLDAPLFVIGPEERIERPLGGEVHFIDRGDFEIGMLGAKYFLSLGNFNSFCYIQHIATHAIPINDRERGFCKVLEDSGHHCESLMKFGSHETTDNFDRLKQWLKSIPKPAAILCYYDPPAVQVLNACHELGLHVPSQVAVLGVDNDTPICEAATPQLSSIQPDHENLGYLAARQLHAILSHRKSLGRKIRLTHRIIERETTKPIAPSANLVRRALAYIAENATKGIGVQDVVESLGVSRRLADLRFREIEGTSIHDVIETQKLKIAMQKLKGTEWPIGRIATTCGYTSLQTFEAAFRKRFGRSPRSFRHTEKNVPSDGRI